LVGAASCSVSDVDGTSCLSDWRFETAAWIVSVIAVIGAVTASRRLSKMDLDFSEVSSADLF
jgi:hypothetical protein